ncbi:MAG: ATP-binding protein [Candidatus Nanopelagicaceae bacterium]
MLELDIRPGVEMLATCRHYGYKTWFALAEFVDNSVASHKTLCDRELIPKGQPLTVEILFNEVYRTVQISDDAGGIEKERIQDALIAGKPPQDRTGLNQFGLGLKTAAFWFGSTLSMETYPIGEDIKIVVDVSLERVIAGGEKVNAEILPIKHGLHGTTLTLSNLWGERSVPTKKTLGKVRSYLASIYRDNLKQGKLRLSVDGQWLEAPVQNVLEAPRWDSPLTAPQKWEKLVNIDMADGKHVAGIVWLLSKGDTANAGLVLTWRGKAIIGAGAGADDSNDSYRPTEVFGQPNSFESQRICGEFDMSEFPVTSRKDGLEWSDDEQREFASKLKRELDSEPLPMLKMARNFRKRIKLVDVENDIREAVRSVAESFQDIALTDFPANTLDLIPEIEIKSDFPDSNSGESTQDEEPIGFEVPLPRFLFGLEEARLRVVYDILSDMTVGYSKEEKTLVIEVNRASVFLQNYAAIPQFHLEPVLRVLTAVVLAELKATGEGIKGAKRVTDIINRSLNTYLSQISEPDDN